MALKLNPVISGKMPSTAAQLPQAPKTLEELEAQLLQSISRLDCGEGADGKESLLRLRKRMKEFRL